MKTFKIAFILSIFAFMQCSPPDLEPLPLSRAEILMQDLKQSQVYYDLESLNFDLDLDQVEVGEFPQFELVTIPVKNSSKTLYFGSRKSTGNSAIVLKFHKNGSWEHFLKIDLAGQYSVGDYSDFSGEIVIDAYFSGSKNTIKYLNGEFVHYSINSAYASKQGISVLARNENEAGCQSICHMLDCAGLKFEQRGWIGKLWCAYSIFPCLIGEIIECESEGCANSVYKECGML